MFVKRTLCINDKGVGSPAAVLDSRMWMGASLPALVGTGQQVSEDDVGLVAPAESSQVVAPLHARVIEEPTTDEIEQTAGGDLAL